MVFRFLGRTGSSVGDDILSSSAGRKLVQKRLANEGLQNTAANRSLASADIAAEINQGILTKTQGFSKQIDNAILKESPSGLARIAANQSEQAAKYADELAQKLGDPDLAKPLERAFRNKQTKIYREATEKQARSTLGKTSSELAGEGAQELAEANTGTLMRVVNGAWANKGKIGIGLVVAGAGFVIWSGSMNLLSDVASTLERWGFLPTGTGDKIIAFWSRLRGVITVALFVGGFILVFYVMNMVFGTAKAVGAVADAVTPDAGA